MAALRAERDLPVSCCGQRGGGGGGGERVRSRDRDREKDKEKEGQKIEGEKRQRQRHHAEATVNGRAWPGGETRACHRSLGPWLRGGPLEGALCKAHTQEWTVFWVYIRK